MAYQTDAETVYLNAASGRVRPVELDAADIYTVSGCYRCRWADVTPSESSKSASVSVKSLSSHRCCGTPSEASKSIDVFRRRRWADMTPSEASKSVSLSVKLSVFATASLGAASFRSGALLEATVAAATSFGLRSWTAEIGHQRRLDRRRAITFSKTADAPPVHAAEVASIPSKGSRLHDLGECKPCAWYYKSHGCRDGAECDHCHLCPEDALKKRKAQKARAAASAKSNIASVSLASTTQGDSHNSEGTACALPSKGSELHVTRECKPCSWFWKPGGCLNGSECLHCHLCPADEHQKRKTAKVSVMRSRAKGKRPFGSVSGSRPVLSIEVKR